MSKQATSGSQNKQSEGSASKQSTDAAQQPKKSGKDAQSHTKSDTGKGAGGGAKQARKH